MSRICNHCNSKAIVRCRKHGGYLCGSNVYCTNLHRWNRGNCEFVSPRRFDPMQLLLTACGISVAAVATVMAWAHLARVR